MNVGGWRDRLLGHPRATQIRSLAVIPFDNLSGDAEQELFCRRDDRALITDLGQIQALRVISRTSVMRYKGARKPARSSCPRVDVDAIVEGSVSVPADLRRLRRGWFMARQILNFGSKSYQRELQNVLIMQGEVASAIVHEIDVTSDSPGEGATGERPAGWTRQHKRPTSKAAIIAQGFGRRN